MGLQLSAPFPVDPEPLSGGKEPGVEEGRLQGCMGRKGRDHLPPARKQKQDEHRGLAPGTQRTLSS